MSTIKLKAILRAYSKSPIYDDFIRDVFAQEGTSSNTQYVRVYNETFDANGNPISGNYTGEWVPLDTSLLEKPLKDFEYQVKELNKNLDTIHVSIDIITNKLKFVDGNGIVSYYELPSAKVDYKTINIDHETYRMYTVDTPDESTLKEVDIVYENGLDINGNPIPNHYGIVSKVSGKLRVEGIYVKDTDKIISGNELNDRLLKAEKNIRDLEDYTQGTGGYLDPINLGYLYRLNPDDDGFDILQAQERNTRLSHYAYTQLNNDNSYTPVAIPDQTKIQNTYDGILWVYIESENFWYNNGTDIVVQANNNGVLGVVTGSLDKFKANIDEDGTISINNLQEEFNQVIYSKEASIDPLENTYAKRSSTGQIKANDPKEEDDVATLRYIERWYASNKITNEQIDSLFGGNN